MPKSDDFSPFAKLRFDVIGLAMKVQNRLGRDHAERVYHQAFLTDLRNAGYAVEDRPAVRLPDANGKTIATYIPDMRLTRDGITVLLEIKSDPGGLQESHRRQARAYLSADKTSRAVLLINFGSNHRNASGKRVLEYESFFRKDL